MITYDICADCKTVLTILWGIHPCDNLYYIVDVQAKGFTKCPKSGSYHIPLMKDTNVQPMAENLTIEKCALCSCDIIVEWQDNAPVRVMGVNAIYPNCPVSNSDHEYIKEVK